VILFSSLSEHSLRELLRCNEYHIGQTLKSLHAILDIPDNQPNQADTLHLHHPSFRDFLLSKDRCGDFWVDEKEAHRVLAAGCIQLMSKKLKKVICELHASGQQASQVESSVIQ
jgi:hypothetical protein